MDHMAATLPLILLVAAAPCSAAATSRTPLLSSCCRLNVAPAAFVPRRWRNHAPKAVAAAAAELAESDGEFGRLLSLSGIAGAGGRSPRLTLRPNRLGYRGVHADCPEDDVREGDVLLSVPLASCIRSTDAAGAGGEQLLDDDERWPLALARSFLLRERDADDADDPIFTAWSSLLPDPDELRVTLPVHWSDDAIDATGLRSFRAEVQADRRVRCDLVRELTMIAGTTNDDDEGLLVECDNDRNGVVGSEGSMEKKAQRRQRRRRSPSDVLDLIYTRAVRTEVNGEFIGHVLAPGFDMINHAGHGWSNAAYGVEEEDAGSLNLVVRAERGLDPGEEILINYGEGARDLGCLHHYGFLPDPARGGELCGDAEVMDDEGNAHILKRRCFYGVSPELLRAASDAVRITSGGNGGENADTHPMLGEAEAVWIVGRIDDAIHRLEDASKLEGGGSEGVDGNLSMVLASNVRRAVAQMLARCRRDLIAERVKSPFRRVELALRKPASVR